MRNQKLPLSCGLLMPKRIKRSEHRPHGGHLVRCCALWNRTRNPAFQALCGLTAKRGPVVHYCVMLESNAHSRTLRLVRTIRA
jgi:hypothetical protein